MPSGNIWPGLKASLKLADQARTDVVRFLHPDSAVAGALS